ncbi:MAG: hypothetical protein M2R45_01190 [Verrucomicrobia subdivision 3 bacterium]|nr:hypothetical protein [Limisphaerales bacterium]MCS1415257.1 hypothetical protein [Limisphaerales bacterium]
MSVDGEICNPEAVFLYRSGCSQPLGNRELQFLKHHVN